MNYKVYRHTFPNGKIYIGITNMSVNRRWRNNGEGYKGQFIYRAITKYGWENVKHEILFEDLTKEQAEQKEIELIAFYKSNQREFGYNISNGGNSLGMHSEESKRKMSESRKGLLAGEKNPMWRKEVSLETRQKISNALKGRKQPREFVERCSEKRRGQKRTLEQRQRMSMAQRGRIVSDSTREKLRIASTGRKHTEESKRKMSDAQKGRKGIPCSESAKKKISEANKGENNFFYGKHHTDEVKEFLSQRLSKPIICVETNKVYRNTKQASIDLGNKDRTNILSALRGKTQTAYGYHWRYYDE